MPARVSFKTIVLTVPGCRSIPIPLKNGDAQRPVPVASLLLPRRASFDRGSSYGAQQSFEKTGGRDRDRTCDPYHVKVVLYR